MSTTEDLATPPPAVEIIVEIKLPVAVSVFCAISEALGKTRGPDLFTRQVGDHLQIFKQP